MDRERKRSFLLPSGSAGNLFGLQKKVTFTSDALQGKKNARKGSTGGGDDMNQSHKDINVGNFEHKS